MNCVNVCNKSIILNKNDQDCLQINLEKISSCRTKEAILTCMCRNVLYFTTKNRQINPSYTKNPQLNLYKIFLFLSSLFDLC